MTMFAMAVILLITQDLSGSGGQAEQTSDETATTSAVSVRPSTAADLRTEFPPHTLQTVVSGELRELLKHHAYTPVPLETAREIARNLEQSPPAAMQQGPRIRSAVYQARLSGDQLTSGRLQLETYPISHETALQPLMLGTVNLTDLKVFDGDEPVTIAAHPDRRLCLLNSGFAQQFHGTWSLEGGVTGDNTTFRLELPNATTSSLELHTAPGISITSANALVMGPEPDGQQLRWRIFPNVSSRLTLTCRIQRLAAAGSPLSLSTLTENHVVTGDTLVSRWALSLPSDLHGRDEILLSLPADLRITDVLLNDNQPLQWSVDSEGLKSALTTGPADQSGPDSTTGPADQSGPDSTTGPADQSGPDSTTGPAPTEVSEPTDQKLTVRLPRIAGTITLTLHAASTLPASTGWSIPLLKPLAWHRSKASVSGPILMPTSQISLTLPPEMDLDGWSELSGIQELDVISAQDGAVIYQLTRFVADAVATVTTSSSQSATSETLVSMVDQTGRLMTATCFLQVRSEQGTASDLEWQVNSGWDVVNVRYASGGRALFFEFGRATEAAGSGRLRVHLPDPLETGSETLVQLNLQQSDLAGTDPSLLPLARQELRKRPSSFLVVTPEVRVNDSAMAIARSQPAISSRALRSKYVWLPAELLTDDSLVFDVNAPDTADFLRTQRDDPANDMAGTLSSPTAEVLCRIFVDNETVTQTTRMVFPADLPAAALSFRLPVIDSAAISWTLNGRPIEAMPDTAAAADDLRRSDDTPQVVWQLSNGPQDEPDALDRNSGRTVVVCTVTHPLQTLRQVILPFPVKWPTWQGRLIVESRVSLPVLPEGLVEAASGETRSADSDQMIRVWTLPSQPVQIPLIVDQRYVSQRVMTADSHVFHLIEDTGQSLIHTMVLLSQLSHYGSHDRLEISPNFGSSPLVFVNGRRVALLAQNETRSISLPASDSVSQLLIFSDPQFLDANSPTTILQLNPLLTSAAGSQLATHHLMVSPTLAMRSPAADWQTSAPVDVLEMYDSFRRSQRTPTDSAVTAAAELSESPSSTGRTQGTSDLLQPLRTFSAEWRLNAALGWHQRTLATPRADESRLTIVLTSILLKRVLQYAMIVVTLTAGYVLAGVLARFRITLLMVAVAVVLLRWSAVSDIADALLTGFFWGLVAIVALLTSPVWLVSRKPRRGPGVSSAALSVATVLLLLLTCMTVAAAPQSSPNLTGPLNGPVAVNSGPQRGTAPQNSPVSPQPSVVVTRAQQPPADILIVNDAAMSATMAFVRDERLKEWYRQKQNQPAPPSSVMVTSARIVIQARDLQDIEAVLKLRIAVVHRPSEYRFSIDLGTAQLVECLIDDQLVLPQSSEGSRIDIPVPGRMALPEQELPEQELPEQEKSESADTVLPNESVADEHTAAADSPSRSVMAKAGPLVLWDHYDLQIRMRPRLTGQANGVRFDVPTVPCPDAAIQIHNEEGSIHRGFVQTEAGTQSWVPDDGSDEFSVGGLSAENSVEFRLFASEESQNVSDTAALQRVTICELSAGQQILTTVCHITNWNPLVRNLRLPVPDGYRLLSVSCAQAPRLFWSVSNQLADLQLNELNSDSLFLELRFVSEFELPPLQHRLRVAAFGAVEGCNPAADSLVAVRTTREFSVQQVGSELPAAVSVTSVPALFSSWLRATDVLFAVPSEGMDEVRFRLTPQTPLNEVRIVQQVTCRRRTIDWNFVAFIETFYGPVFRHQLRVGPDIEVTDVQVYAGEANRLESFRQHEDRLLVLLKEGTTGPHRVVVSGTQLNDDTETDIRLVGFQLMNTPVLESSLTVNDAEGSGLAFRDVGTAVPDRRLQPDQPLLPANPVRFQIREDGSAIVLRRQRLSPREADLCIAQVNDDVTVFVRIPSFPEATDAQQMTFPPDTAFLRPPQVVVHGQPVMVTQRGNQFSWETAAQHDNAGEPDLVAVWTALVPDRSGENADVESRLATLPEWSFDLNWKQTLLARDQAAENEEPMAVDSISSEASAQPWFGEQAIWVSDVAEILQMTSPANLLDPVPVQVNGNRILNSSAVPLDISEVPGTETVERVPVVIADTAAFALRNESVLAQTSFTILSPADSGSLLLQVPDEIVITRIAGSPALRWTSLQNGRLNLELHEPVSVLSIQWMGKRSHGDLLATRVQLTPPIPLDCDLYSGVTLRSADGGVSGASGPATSMTTSEFNEFLRTSLERGLTATLIDSTSNLNSTEWIEPHIKAMALSREQFFRQLFSTPVPGTAGTGNLPPGSGMPGSGTAGEMASGVTDADRGARLLSGSGPWRYRLSDEPIRISGLTVSDAVQHPGIPADGTGWQIAIRRIPPFHTLVPLTAVLVLLIAVVLSPRTTAAVAVNSDHGRTAVGGSGVTAAGARTRDDAPCETRIQTSSSDIVAPEMKQPSIKRGSSDSAAFTLHPDAKPNSDVLRARSSSSGSDLARPTTAPLDSAIADPPPPPPELTRSDLTRPELTRSDLTRPDGAADGANDRTTTGSLQSQLPDNGRRSGDCTIDGKPVQTIGHDQTDQPSQADDSHHKADQSSGQDG